MSRAPGLVAALLAVSVTAGACGRGAAPSGGPTTPPAVSTSSPAASTTPAGPSYDAAGLDLCARTDLKPLADLSLTVKRKDPKPPTARPGAACLFEMHTAAGYEANLRVEASTLGTVEEAQQLYRGTGKATDMTPQGPVTGVGDEAEAFSKRSEPGFKYAEYMVHARTGNLVVKVWLAVGGDSYVATQTLAAKALAVLNATRAAVPTA